MHSSQIYLGKVSHSMLSGSWDLLSFLMSANLVASATFLQSFSNLDSRHCSCSSISVLFYYLKKRPAKQFLHATISEPALGANWFHTTEVISSNLLDLCGYPTISVMRGQQESYATTPYCCRIFRLQVLRQSVECQRINIGGRSLPCDAS